MQDAVRTFVPPTAPSLHTCTHTPYHLLFDDLIILMMQVSLALITSLAPLALPCPAWGKT